MEFMLLFMERRGAPTDTPDGMAEMKAFVDDLASRGQLRRGAPLHSEGAAARIRVRAGKALVTDGPFAESKEVVAGFWVIDVDSREEAVDIACRCPHARNGIVEVRHLSFRDAVADPGEGTPFLFAFRMEPGLIDPDGSKLREMIEHGNTLKRAGKFLETAPLADDPPAARVEVRGGKILSTDGPFAEAKEMVGGYSLIRAASRADAIELAKRYPHAKWGPVEVREIRFFD